MPISATSSSPTSISYPLINQSDVPSPLPPGMVLPVQFSFHHQSIGSRLNSVAGRSSHSPRLRQEATTDGAKSRQRSVVPVPATLVSFEGGCMSIDDTRVCVGGLGRGIEKILVIEAASGDTGG